jgi:hypothetical protein
MASASSNGSFGTSRNSPASRRAPWWPGGVQVRLAGLELARGDHDELAPVRVAELTLEQHLAAVEERHHRDRAGVADVFARAAAAVGQAHRIAVHLEQAAVEHQAAADAVLGQVRGL